MQAWCDRYFFLPARREHRGVGGIFFDDLAAEDQQVAAAEVSCRGFMTMHQIRGVF